MNQKIFAMFATILMLGTLATPVVAVENNYDYKCDDYDVAQQLTTEITLSDLDGAEIEIIDGLPFIVVESEDECIYMPFYLSDTIYMMADDVPVTVEVDGTYLLIPTEDGIERVCISEFDVGMVDGQLMLVHEVNPVWKVPAIIIAIVKSILRALVVIVGGCVVWELRDWYAGRCASPWCGESDPDFGLFCGHPRCPATVHGFYVPNHWIRG